MPWRTINIDSKKKKKNELEYIGGLHFDLFQQQHPKHMLEDIVIDLMWTGTLEAWYKLHHQSTLSRDVQKQPSRSLISDIDPIGNYIWWLPKQVLNNAWLGVKLSQSQTP